MQTLFTGIDVAWGKSHKLFTIITKCFHLRSKPDRTCGKKICLTSNQMKRITNVEKRERTIDTPANVEWDDTNGIPYSNITFVLSIKKDKCKHAVQHVDKLLSMFFVLQKNKSNKCLNDRNRV